MKMKIQINDNFNSIYNYIISSQELVTYKGLIQFCMDYQCYQEFYINLNVWKLLIDEQNNRIYENLQEISNKTSIL